MNRYTEGGSHTKVKVGEKQSVIPRHAEVKETASAVIRDALDQYLAAAA